MEEHCKLVIVGDTGVGKTCLAIQFCTNVFPTDYVPTVFDNYNTNVLVEDRKVMMSIWDTQCSEEYDKLRALSYYDTNVVMITFALNDRKSFQNITEKWLPEIKHYSGSDSHFIIVGTKSDLRFDTSSKFVSSEEGIKLSEELGAVFYAETSALTSIGVIQCFKAVAEVAVRRFPNKGRTPSRQPSDSGSMQNCLLM